MNDQPRYAKLMEFYTAVSRYKRAHQDQLPPQPLHFTEAQWKQFALDRLATQAMAATGIDEVTGSTSKTIYGLRAERHRDHDAVKGFSDDSCPERWPYTPADQLKMIETAFPDLVRPKGRRY